MLDGFECENDKGNEMLYKQDIKGNNQHTLNMTTCVVQMLN